MPGGEEHLIQIRYSDTHEQKMLKQQTAAGRVFRAAEYEVGVAQARGYGDGEDRFLSVSPDQQTPANEFERFLQGQMYVMDVTFSAPLTNMTVHRNPAPYMPSSARYRQPWQPSPLGMSRPAMHSMAHPSTLSSEHVSEPCADIKTIPATPVKEDASGSPTRRAGSDA
jgi:hypothetical protein